MIFFDKSPIATAIVTAAMLRTCVVRFDAMKFTESSQILPRLKHLRLALATGTRAETHFARHRVARANERS